MTAPATTFNSDIPPLSVGMVLYPGFTLLDLAGPLAILGPHSKIALLWKTLEPVTTDGPKVSINPNTTFEDCPDDLDVLFVPGGFDAAPAGTNGAMQDSELVAFVRRAGLGARYVTAVCTGSLVLGMSGLLDGYRAATHWASYEALEAMGIDAVRERVVIDRNRVTGGGVTAGIDFALTLLAELRGEQVARLTQLLCEYDPKPPFDSGSPEGAGPELTGIAVAMGRDLNARSVEIARTRRREPADA